MLRYTRVEPQINVFPLEQTSEGQRWKPKRAHHETEQSI